MDPTLDADLRVLLAEDPDRGWRAFIERHTPTLVSLIERAGLRDRDEAMEIYTLVCERLAEQDCARLRSWNPAKGALGAWLAVVVRRVTVDWVRSRAGRRRLFGAVRKLADFDQRVFELYFWEDRLPSAIAEELTVASKRDVDLADVLSALDRIHAGLAERHYSELVSFTMRSKPPVSLDVELEQGRADVADPGPSAEARLQQREQQAAVEAALAGLPIEDAAIVRLHYYQGLSLADVRRALLLPELSRVRVTGIVAALKDRLAHLAARAGAPRSRIGGSSA